MAETVTLDSSTHPPQLPDENPTGNDDEDMLDAPKSTKSSDSDSDSEDDAQQNLQIQALQTELLNNPSNYDAHVQYIKALRKQGDIEKLRQAREAMNAIFPLSFEMWQEWTKDETSLSSGPEALPAIEKLFERGVSDYLSVALWCDYLSFVQEHDQSVRTRSVGGISKARNLFERALVAAGLHVAEGSRIWELYREFEQDLFLTIDETDADLREKQVQRIRNLFHRQLSVPLADISSTLHTYKAWEAKQGADLDVDSSNLDGLSPHVASSYQKALDMMNARTHLENQISCEVAPESERLQNFMAYLKFEQSLGDPARIQILYERAITEFPISSELWLDYTHYMDKTLKTSSLVRDIYKRATRNCPWIGDLWVRYLLSLERSRASEEELSAVFEKALQCTFSSFEEYLDVFLTRVDGLRRRLSSLESGTESSDLDYIIIRETFQRASDYLSPHLKNTESLLRMYRYWSRLESTLGKDLAAARRVWESLLKISGSTLEAWQGYIAMEVEMGKISEARSLFKRCYSKRFPGSGSEDICNSWIRFEREYGALEDFDFAVKKVTPRLEELQLFKLQEAKNIGVPADDRDNSSRKNVREKRKPVSNLIEEQSPAKRHKDKTKNVKITSEDGKGQAKDSVKVNNTNPDVDASKPASGSKKENKDVSSGKPKQYNDQCTAFVSNLNLKATYDDLRRFFSDVGGVVAIRILNDKFTGKSRGLAYVDFSDDKHLAAAVAKNKQTLLGKRLSIAKSDPKGRKKGSDSHSASSRQGEGAEQTTESSKSGAKDSAEGSKEGKGQPSSHQRATNIQLKGKNTFAVPRTVRPLGWVDKDKPKSEETDATEDEIPKSNDEFRKMFIKS
ncbi:PREDICTED: squamous cell carcinoma antigen recognized by T-cells 3 [Nicotiana attenuata]|uniref:RRM domain-containing protein n=1 Tax=Nicotiana attenuata TaxID=49451 RepID=A0A1J6IRK0_NICAT|nr:PREDICTED: squamous cell carcinoma antigen recognized by T-cells 3 [Nicotiana attenuata]OIT07338.1 hypothetical protein A4A49_17629 [Nicotiana attenuata]